MYKKILNLYLYISPFSSHPPGVLSGLIISNILRIHHLCSEAHQRKAYYKQFFMRLRARGYLPSQLLLLFDRGFELAKVISMPSTKNKRLQREAILQQSKSDPNTKSSDNTVILNVPYHPKSPSSTTVQHIFKNKFLDGKRSVAGFSKLTTAHSRSNNLGEILSYRKVESSNGPPVSSYLDWSWEGVESYKERKKK